MRIKHGTVRADGYRFRGYSHGKEMWLSPIAWNRQKEQARFYNMKKNRGLNRTQYEALLSKQEGCCDCCHNLFDLSNTKAIHVDHNHRTGLIRGLVCRDCNYRISVIENDLDRINTYLIKHSEGGAASP